MMYNAFPNNYQFCYPSYGTAQMSQPQQNPITWVQGEAAAKSYPVAPNNTVQLWDSEAQTIYLKSADASGIPNIKILDYVIREPSTQSTQLCQSNYVTKSELTLLQNEVDELRKELQNGKSSVPSNASTDV